MSLSEPSQGKKHKHMSLFLNDKLCVIEKFKKRSICVEHLCAIWDYQIDYLGLKKEKHDIRKFFLKSNVEKKASALKIMSIKIATGSIP